jgi:transposase
MRRHELTDQQWELIAPFFPANGKRGGQWKDHRTAVNGIFWRLNTGAPWRDLPDRFDKLAVNYLATVKLAILQRYLRKLAPNDSSDRP